MVRVTKCAICGNEMIISFQRLPQDAKCPWCGKPFRYRLIRNSIVEIDLMNLTFGEAGMCDGTGL